VPRLVLLNGPPAVGKSTVAELYADRHPYVLNLDIDRLRCLIGGWRTHGVDTGELVRTMALSMAATHLGAGHDVLVPQYVGSVRQLERFAEVARDCRAAFVELVLMDSRQRSLERFMRRRASGTDPWHDQPTDVVEPMYDRLIEVVASRPRSTVIPSDDGNLAQTYELVVGALEPSSGPRPRAVAVVVQHGRVLVVRRRARGRQYTVLPGGGLEPGESSEQAVLRELFEETTLTARVQRQLWRAWHRDREATYFLMTDVRGVPTLSGEEARLHGPANSYELTWVGPDGVAASDLQPTEIRELVTCLLR
jgi:8-oxo-dGTP pyrophosphatase MutT (NUDIX family)/predicted kinase